MLQVYCRLTSNLNEICYLILVYTCLINLHMIIDYHILWTCMNHIYTYIYIIIGWSIYDIDIYIASTHTYIYWFIYLFITIKYLEALAIVFHVSFQVFSWAVAWNFSPCCARTLHTAVPWDVFVGREMSKITMFKWENQGKSWKWSTHMEKHVKSSPAYNERKVAMNRDREREREGKIS